MMVVIEIPSEISFCFFACFDFSRLNFYDYLTSYGSFLESEESLPSSGSNCVKCFDFNSEVSSEFTGLL